MSIATITYVKKPLYVEAVRISRTNFEEIIAWCGGKKCWTFKTPYIKVPVHNPRDKRQTMAFVGNWILQTERGFKVYTNRTFRESFDKAVGQ